MFSMKLLIIINHVKITTCSEIKHQKELDVNLKDFCIKENLFLKIIYLIDTSCTQLVC